MVILDVDLYRGELTYVPPDKIKKLVLSRYQMT